MHNVAFNQPPSSGREAVMLFEVPESERMAEASEVWRRMLPYVATYLVAHSQDMSHPANQSFATDPDNPLEHQPRWHEYGILTHTLQAERSLRTTVPVYVDRMGLTPYIDNALSREVDGVPRGGLLSLAMLFHDLGKFTARTITERSDGTISRSFAGHEAHSGKIVRGELPADGRALVHRTLKAQGLSDAQIEYIAICAERHFELAQARHARATASDTHMAALTKTEAYLAALREIKDRNEPFALEVGLLFLADNLSKGYEKVVARGPQGAAHLSLLAVERVQDVRMVERYLKLVCRQYV